MKKPFLFILFIFFCFCSFSQIPIYRWVSGATDASTEGTIATTTPNARQGAISFTDSLGNFWLYGGEGVDITEKGGINNDLWKYDSTGTWIWMSGYPVADKAPYEENNSLSFDGIDDEVVLFTDPLDYTSDFTVEAFFKAKSDGPILSFSPDQASESRIGWSLSIENGGTNFYVRSDNNIIPHASSVSLLDNKWHHVAVSFRPLPSYGYTEVIIYIDRQQVQGGYAFDPNNLDPNGSHITTIGSVRGFNDSTFFEGQIDEVRFWSTVRTLDEIQGYSLSAIRADQDSLKAYYTFDQGTANARSNLDTLLKDTTANQIDGAIMNTIRPATFVGQMAEVRLWNSALSEAQVRQSAQTTVTGAEQGLNGAYDFNLGSVIAEGNNTEFVTLFSLTTNNNEGTLSNFNLDGPTSNYVSATLPAVGDRYAAPSTSTIAIAADFTGDSYEDIIVNGGTANSLVLYENNQTGGFSSYFTFDVGDNAVDLTTGYFNSDANLDVAIAAQSSTGENRVRVYLGDGFFGDGIGGFSTFFDINTGFGFFKAISAADLNGDTFDDLVVLVSTTQQPNYNVYGADEVHIYLSDGTGAFSPAEVFVVGNLWGESVVIADINNDLAEDIVYSIFNPGPTTIGRLINDGDGTFTQQSDQRYASSLINNIYSYDVNQDGNEDLILSQGASPGVAFGNGDGTFQSTKFSYLGDPEEDRVDELTIIGSTPDNKLELLASHQFYSRYYKLTLDPSGVFEQVLERVVTTKPGHISAADFDKNGFLDFVFPLEGVNEIEVVFAQNDQLERNASVSALDFDGINDFVEVTNLGPFNADFTWEGWIKTEDNGPIFSYTRAGETGLWDESTPEGFSLIVRGEELAFIAEGLGEIATYYEGLKSNEWHHIGVSYNAVSNLVSLFINGNQVSSNVLVISPPAPNTGHTAKLGYGTSNFDEVITQRAQAATSSWKEGVSFGDSGAERAYAAGWTSAAGIFHVFAGKGIDGIHNSILQFDPTNDQWTLVKGSGTPYDTGHYGIKGVGDLLNIPPARFSPQVTQDVNGNIWMFGGTSDEEETQFFNDLWKFDPATNEWTWMSGANMPNDTGSYGTLGAGSVNNIPGARTHHNMWTDAAGDLYVFGGSGLDDAGTFGYLNDLWKYSIATNEWTWVAGSSQSNTAGIYGALGTYASSQMPGGRAASIQWTTPNGIFWFFGGQGMDKFGASEGYLNDLWSYDPALGQWAWHAGSDFKGSTGSYNEQGLRSEAYVPGARWQSTNWVDEEGHIWLFGGYKFNQLTTGLYNDFWQYEPQTKAWTWLNGYATTTNNKEQGVYVAKLEGSTPVPSARQGGLEWTDLDGNLWLLGGAQIGASSFGFYNDLWSYDIEKERWSYVQGSRELVLNEGVYGAKGIGSETNDPKSRWHGASWTGLDGKLWFFGGINHNQETNNIAWINDLWFYDPASNVYTWMGGSKEVDASGVYGLKGEASVGHIPGARSSCAYWSDDEGNFWLFGGYERFEYNNDLWKYSPSTAEWTWVSGNNFQNSPGVYGEKQISSPDNIIGARRYMDGRKDPDGNVWIFGGQGYDAEAQFGYLSDLWKYTPATNEWTWISGSKFRNPAANFGTKGVASESNSPPARYGHSMWIDESGNIWIYGGLGNIEAGDNNGNVVAGELNDLWTFDTKTNQWTWVGGENSLDYAGDFIVKGAFSELNALPARQRALTFAHNDKTLRFFGGRNGASYGTFWEIKFTPATPEVVPPEEERIGQESFSLAFKEPWARTFQVEMSLSSDFSGAISEFNSPSDSITIAGLSSGTYYHYRVRASNEIGSSDFTIADSVLTLPETPTFASLSEAVSGLTHSQATLNWEATPRILEGYYLDISQDENFLDTALVHSDFSAKPIAIAQTQALDSLLPGTRYFARLRSFNRSGASPPSQTVSFLTAPATPTFDATQVVTEVTESTAVISWNAVPEILTGYQLTLSTLDDGHVDSTAFLVDYTARNINKSNTSFRVSGLEPGLNYFAYLVAVNASGASLLSDKITILTTPASPVFNVATAADEITQTGVTLRWEAPQGTFSTYELQVSVDQSFVNTNLMLEGYGKDRVPFVLAASELSTSVVGLLPGQTYYARIRALNASGESPYSNVLSFTTVPASPISTNVNNISQSEATLVWQPATGADIYLVDLNAAPDFTDGGAILTAFPLAVPFQVLEGLNAGTRYYARVQSSNTSGNSGDMVPADYDEINFITIPATPEVSDITYNQTSISVSWPEIEGVTHYEVSASENFFLSFLSGFEALSVSAPSVEVTGLDAGSEYQIRLRSANQSGASPAVQLLDLITLPGTPVARAATNFSASVFTANWDPSVGADYYVLEVSDDDFQTLFYNEQQNFSNPVQITDLVSGTTYKYRIKAVNGSGDSPYSNVISILAQNSAQSLTITEISYNDEFGSGTTSALVTARTANGVGDPEVLIRHREILNSEWSELKPMTQGATGAYEFTLFANMLDEIGVAFEILANDGITFLESGDHQIKRIFSESNSAALPPLTLGEWGMISIPYVLEDNLVTSIFNELGDAEYKKKWRLMTYQDGEYKDQGVGFTRIELGKGYWFNSLRDVTINVGAGQTNGTIPFEMPLVQGWNQIGNPYSVTINWAETIDNNQTTFSIGNAIIYDAEEGVFKESNTLAPFEGAFVFVDQATVVSVTPMTGASGGRIETPSTRAVQFSNKNWRLPLVLSSEGRSLDIAALGMHEEAAQSKDRFDKMAVPRFDAFTEMYTYHSSYFYPKFKEDITPQLEENIWHFELASNTLSGYSTLSWDPGLIRDFLWLVDEDAGRVVSMNTSDHYAFVFSDARNISIHYSKDPNYVVTPSKFSLGNAYPNPAQSLVYIPVLLPESDENHEIKLDLYDMQGRQIQTIVNGTFEAGVHTFILEIDEDIHDGLYFYKVSVGGAHPTTHQKKLLIKKQ